MKDYHDNYYRNFHLVMLISSVYLSMLLTNWGAVDFNSKDWKTFTTSDSSKFIKFISAWGTSALYLWTIVAPLLFPDRNFH
jgi:serine incorporator 1/3